MGIFEAGGVPVLDEERCKASARAEWGDPDRRHTYLLRTVPDVPISLDPLVLPKPNAACVGASGHAHIRLVAMAHPKGEALEHMAAAHCLYDFVDPSAATLLGFDVVDGSISGLSNCGYRPEAHDALVAAWAPLLNEHHLLVDLGAAERFARATDLRVP
jgi:hypothetical protein